MEEEDELARSLHYELDAADTDYSVPRVPVTLKASRTTSKAVRDLCRRAARIFKEYIGSKNIGLFKEYIGSLNTWLILLTQS